MAERELTDILLNHSTGFDHELDDKIQDFYDRIAALIKRSLDLGIEMNLVRNSDTRAVSYAILGGIKELIGMLSRSNDADPSALVEEILAVRLERRRASRAVEIRARAGEAAGEAGPTGELFFWAQSRLTCQFTIIRKRPTATRPRLPGPRSAGRHFTISTGRWSI